ncbi:MAG TPA: hypothetical protein VME45_19860, partial [Stellaceae bacterium]|nr:hypothetical protein [Stellaceae bacterium]
MPKIYGSAFLDFKTSAGMPVATHPNRWGPRKPQAVSGCSIQTPGDVDDANAVESLAYWKPDIRPV